MNQFTVPQFIDAEDRILGPITTRQFVILLVSGIIFAVCYKIPGAVSLVIGVVQFILSLILAFVKINGMPYHFFALNFVQTRLRSSVRLWDCSYGKVEYFIDLYSAPVVAAAQKTSAKVIDISRLNELALIVDSRGTYQGEKRDDGEHHIL